LANRPVKVLHQVNMNAGDIHKIQFAMRDVVKNPRGTAHRVLSHASWTAAGKTGTAQVVKMSQHDDKEISKEVLDRRHKDHAWFMGYAPYKHPKIAIAVFVEHGGHGGSAAGPVAAAVIEAMAKKEAAITEVQAQ